MPITQPTASSLEAVDLHFLAYVQGGCKKKCAPCPPCPPCPPPPPVVASATAIAAPAAAPPPPVMMMPPPEPRESISTSVEIGTTASFA